MIPCSRVMHLLSLPHSSSFYISPNLNFRVSCSQRTPFISNVNSKVVTHEDLGWKNIKTVDIPIQHRGEKDRIKEALLKTDYSVSSYDTAWVAMVPSPNSSKHPCFPKCIEWILENQHHNGSWGLINHDSSLIKDKLSSTLACILALRKWNVGEEHVKRGLHFIGANYSSIVDKKLLSPIGFDIIFPGMINYAIGMGLDIPMLKSDIDVMLSIRDLEWNRLSGDFSDGSRAYIAFVAEGLRELVDWQEIMKYQKTNGSLFNSPSSTAALVINTHDGKALNYLHSLMKEFGNSAPTVYPLDIHTQLHTIDELERFGISRHFSYEIKSNLDNIFRCWVHDDEDITLDAATCALAFRILRMNGYDVSSDALARFVEVDKFNNLIERNLRDVNTVLELYKASQSKILQNEQVLEKVELWSSCYLKQKLSNDDELSDEVDYTLKFPFYANLDRLEHKRNIEHYKMKKFQLLKTAFTWSINNKDILNMAVDEFNFSQLVYRKELVCLESWVKENKLDQLEFARQKQAYCYLSTAATLFPPEMSDARMSWAKNSVLTTVVDDFFDVGGSREELVNIISLVEKWDGNHETEFCSKQVEIIFSAVYNLVNELGAKALSFQNRDITKHIIQIWLDLMKSMMKEAEWLRNKTMPTLEEYMQNGYVSFALGPIILPALYFVGPQLSDDIIGDPDFHNLYKLVSTCGRLLNDIQGFQRETNEGKLNSLSLRMLHSNGSISKDRAKEETESIISSTRRELLRLVLIKENSAVPKDCKELFWKMSKVLHLFYMRNDGFSSPKEMVSAVNAVIHEPLDIAHLKLSSNA